MKIFNPFTLLFLILIVFMIDKSFAQSKDSVTYSEERKDTSDYRYRRLYQYLDINMKDEKWMFKVSPDFSISKSNKQFGLQISYEHKIYRQFSFLVYNTNTFIFQQMPYYTYWSAGSQFGNTNDFFHSNIGAGFRWYCNLNNRIAKGASGNNFNGLYVEAGIEDIANYISGGVYYRQPNSLIFVDNGFHVFPSFDPRIALGFQRRFNNWSYFDVFSTTNLSYGSLYWDLGFRLGFAWGNNK